MDIKPVNGWKAHCDSLMRWLSEQDLEIGELRGELNDLRSGEYLARVIEERDRYRKALERIAAYDDVSGDHWLRSTGSYAHFDEPGSVQIAREALESANEPT